MGREGWPGEGPLGKEAVGQERRPPGAVGGCWGRKGVAGQERRPLGKARGRLGGKAAVRPGGSRLVGKGGHWARRRRGEGLLDNNGGRLAGKAAIGGRLRLLGQEGAGRPLLGRRGGRWAGGKGVAGREGHCWAGRALLGSLRGGYWARMETSWEDRRWAGEAVAVRKSGRWARSAPFGKERQPLGQEGAVRAGEGSPRSREAAVGPGGSRWVGKGCHWARRAVGRVLAATSM